MMKTTSSIQLVAPPSGAPYTSPACRAFSLENAQSLCNNFSSNGGNGGLDTVGEGGSGEDWYN